MPNPSYRRVEPGVKFSCDIDYDPFRLMQERDLKYGNHLCMFLFIHTLTHSCMFYLIYSRLYDRIAGIPSYDPHPLGTNA